MLCCEKNSGLKKGPWTPDEDQKLIEYIKRHGYGSWRALPKRAGITFISDKKFPQSIISIILILLLY